jgi:2,4-dienoyl-CoA reductase-like NADH-dependent reductase (Old Yellow Enzyme family)
VTGSRNPPPDRPPPKVGGPVLGTLMLDAPYFTIPGGLSHPDTFDAGLVNRIVPGALGTVVAGPNYETVTDAYVRTAQEVAAAGATLLTTNCGFAVVYQDAIREKVDVPTVSSTLPWLSWLHAVHGPRVGVMTWDANQLDVTRRDAARWNRTTEVPVADVQHVGAWRRLAHTDPTAAELEEMRDGLLDATQRFVTDHRLSALLMECTGFAAFSQHVARATGAATFDVVTAVRQQLQAQEAAFCQPAIEETRHGRP